MTQQSRTRALRSAPVRPEPVPVWMQQLDDAAALLKSGGKKPATVRRPITTHLSAPQEREELPEPPVRLSVSSIVGAVVSILRKAWL